MRWDDDFFGGMFDLDGDGKTTIDEEWIAYNIIMGEDEEDEEGDED